MCSNQNVNAMRCVCACVASDDIQKRIYRARHAKQPKQYSNTKRN